MPPNLLHPNTYNPNRMTAEEFGELVAEVKHLARLPKPVVVRKNSDGFLIVDGEHGWRAAQEAGLTEIPCEVIDANDFEAMRQTYKRNQHGTHNPVLLGRMFRQMMTERKLSQRGLAEEIGVSEGTVRNMVLWANAAEMRNGYAPDEDQPFERMSIRELRLYVLLPPPIGDLWLDDGAPADLSDYLDGGGADDIAAYFRDMLAAGLLPMLERRPFMDSFKKAKGLLEWREKFGKYIPDVDAYLKPVIESGLTAQFADENLPAVPGAGGITIPIDPEEWGRIVRDCVGRADGELELLAMMGASLRVALSKRGIDVQDVHDPRVIEIIERIKDAPEFIRDAEHMTRGQKLWLHQATADFSDDVVLKIKRHVCEIMKMRHDFLTGKDEVIAHLTPDHIGQLAMMWVRRTVEGEFERLVQEEVRNRQLAERDRILDDRNLLMERMTERFREYYSLREGYVDGRPAMEVIRERLGKLDWPEFVMLAAYVLKDEFDMSPEQFWFDRIGGEVKQPCSATTSNIDAEGPA